MDDTTRQDLDDGPVNLDQVADRLEAALARIGQRLEAPPQPPVRSQQTAALTARLDGLIGRLRDALGRGADPADGGAGG